MRTLFDLPLAMFLLVLTVPSLATGDAASPPDKAAVQADSDARELIRTLTKKYGDGYVFEVEDELKLVFATAGDRKALGELKGGLVEYARALQNGLFPCGPGRYIAVIVPREWKGTAKGFYNPEDRTITLKAPSSAVLTREFTHVVHHADQQARNQVLHQNWIIEGLATLYEEYRIADGHLIPLPNYRLKIIQNLVKNGHHKPWTIYVKFSQKEFMREPGNHYSQARYMFVYLHEKGLLKKWYDAYVKGCTTDPAGAQAFEQVFGKKLAEIEKDWVEWLVKLPLPSAEPKSGKDGSGGAVLSR
jgi:hypothetical protein